MLNFNHLYYFHVAASEGAIKIAADRLGVTQPTVSEQVRLLERSLGVQLFDRTPTGLKLTQAGRDAYEHTKTMFTAGDRLVAALGRSTAPPTLSLRVGVSAAVARTTAADFLMPVLTVDRWRPSVRTGDFSELMRELRAHDIDLVIGETELLEGARQDLEVQLLHRQALVAICAANVTPRADWEDVCLLEYRPSSAYHWEIAKLLEEHSLRPKTAGDLDDAFLMLEAVARGGFVAFVPRSVAREAIRAGRVKALTSFVPSGTGVHAIFHSDESGQVVRDAVSRLIESAKESFEES